MVNFRVELCTNSNKLLISCVLLSTGAGLLIGWSWIFNSILRVGVVLRENSFMESLWLENPMPLNLELYAFNWTNPEDIYTPGVKPKFKQIGPFSFKEIKTKGNVTYNANDTVSFRQYHQYFFEREKSVADLSLPITTLNPVLTSAAYTANINNWGFWMRKGMSMTFGQLNQKLPITQPFGNYIFDGYPDPLIQLSQAFPMDFVPRLPLDGRFAWFAGRNGTSYEGDFNMGTSYDNFGILENWNYSNRTNHFPGACNSVTGISAGELQRPYPKETIAIFAADICRHMKLDFDEEVMVGGLLGRKYTAGRKFLDNGTLFPENKCFCENVKECFPSGAVNISSCKFGAPGFVSLPNFYDADDFYLNSVEGLSPEKDKHEFFIVLEPTTGIPLRVGARLQLNLLLESSKYISLFENIPKLVFPVLWFEEVVQIPHYLIIAIKILLHLPVIMQITGALLMSIGLWLLSVVLYHQINASLKAVSIHARQKKRMKDHMHKMTITELVPLNEKERLRVVYETDVELIGDALRS